MVKKKIDRNLPVEPSSPPKICGMVGCWEPTTCMVHGYWMCKDHAEGLQYALEGANLVEEDHGEET